MYFVILVIWLFGFLERISDVLLLYFFCRFFKRSEFVNLYYVGFGYVFVLVISVNDSEIFSDVLIDDFMFMTDSSV